MPIAFAIAAGYVLLKPRKRRRTRLRTASRVMFSRHIWMHPSTVLDAQYGIIGALGFSALFGYAMLTGFGVCDAVRGGLTKLFGPHAAPAELPLYIKAFIIFCLYLAFEFAYWFDHFLSHKIAFLWEFHKVHHSATVLTPFANWRVHPVDTIVYLNILSIVMGGVSGLIQYFAGDGFSATSSAVISILFGVYMALWGHLQHSQFWLSCTGLAGRIVLSPAHHQIHHSSAPVHFDKNFGAGLALWDWLFGTLHVPQKRNEHIRFGTEGDAHLKQLLPSVFYPFHYAARRLTAMIRNGNPAPEAADPIPTLYPTAPEPALADVFRRAEVAEPHAAVG
jgi:sterol desaturase/sphingolipid hydroxylase (fatty acid hydroxylase superfamily)